jgi:hypothetical protein
MREDSSRDRRLTFGLAIEGLDATFFFGTEWVAGGLEVDGPAMDGLSIYSGYGCTEYLGSILSEVFVCGAVVEETVEDGVGEGGCSVG